MPDVPSRDINPRVNTPKHQGQVSGIMDETTGMRSVKVRDLLDLDAQEEADWEAMLAFAGGTLPWITDPARRKELGLPEIKADHQAKLEG